MKRRSFRKPVVVLSLFPFLAVLVCTMGALIVLLVMVLQNARVDSNTTADQPPADATATKERTAELLLEKEDEEWRRSELERQRTEYQQQLVQRRLTLSHFEDHIRQLEEKWRQLSAQAATLKQVESQQSTASTDTTQQIQKLRDEIESRKKELAEAQRQAANRRPAYAIVPYDGPNGTKRRPIYIECTDDGIVIQPEGVLLTPADFEGSLGPGNPLDAALRTVREYLAKYSPPDAQGEPYPLLVVRPSGTIAYAVARAAIKSWDDEFGYELIDAELELAYPKPDPTLKRELERSIADARQRQAALAAIMPGRFRQSAAGLVATTSGGFMSLGGQPHIPGTRGASGHQEASFTRTFREIAGDGTETDHSLAATQRSGQGGATGQHGGNPDRGTTTPSGGNAAYPGGEFAGGSQPASGAASAPRSSEAASAPSFHSGGAAGQPGQPSPGQPPQPGQPQGTSTTESAVLGTPSTHQTSASGATPLANARGADWGLPGRSAGATGIQRFIQVECQPDRLLLLYERGDYRTPTVIPMAGVTSAAVDPFVTAIWARTEEWGIAGEGCFWKPFLRVHVAPGAEQRFAELAALLEGSGLVVERKDGR